MERLAELRGHRVELLGPVHGQPAYVRCRMIDEERRRHRRHAIRPLTHRRVHSPGRGSVDVLWCRAIPIWDHAQALTLG
jgi:hypothetical protein